MSQIAHFLQGQSLIFSDIILVILNAQFEPPRLEYAIAFVSTPGSLPGIRNNSRKAFVIDTFSINKEENR